MRIDEYMQKNKLIGKDVYTYALTWTVAELTAGANIPKNVTIENDADFLWTKAQYFATINSTAALTVQTTPVPQANFNWRDTSSSQQIFNIAIPISAFWGSGQLPYILPEPKILTMQTSISIDVTNVHATEAYNLTLAMTGIKLFRA